MSGAEVLRTAMAQHDLHIFEELLRVGESSRFYNAPALIELPDAIQSIAQSGRMGC